MTDQIESRLSELRAEQERGQQMLMKLESEVAEVRAQLLRISGAIQVLEELSSDAGESDSSHDSSDEVVTGKRSE